MQMRLLKEYNPPENLRRRRAASVAEGVDVWTAMLEGGLWAVDARSGRYGLVRDPDP